MRRLVFLLCAGRAAAFKSFSYKRDTVAASTLRELADKLPPLDFERSCYERTPVSDAVAAVFGVPSGTKVPMNTRRGPLEEHQDRPHQSAEDSGERQCRLKDRRSGRLRSLRLGRRPGPRRSLRLGPRPIPRPDRRQDRPPGRRRVRQKRRALRRALRRLSCRQGRTDAV